MSFEAVQDFARSAFARGQRYSHVLLLSFILRLSFVLIA